MTPEQVSRMLAAGRDAAAGDLNAALAAMSAEADKIRRETAVTEPLAIRPAAAVTKPFTADRPDPPDPDPPDEDAQLLSAVDAWAARHRSRQRFGPVTVTEAVVRLRLALAAGPGVLAEACTVLSEAERGVLSGALAGGEETAGEPG